MGAELLAKLVEIANSSLGYNLSDPEEKESHPGKTLALHVKECKELSSLIAEELGLPERGRYFSELLCELHDIGKLHPKWYLGVRGFRHSKEGGEILREILLKNGGSSQILTLMKLNKEELYLLIYFIENHHSALKLPGFRYRKAILEKAGSIINDPRKAILYVDSFGVFKLADFASAVGLGGELIRFISKEWPSAREIEKILNSPDDRRLSKQKEIASQKGHTILSAPTGWGKTLVGFLKAINSRPVKLFYSLPTITAIRKMSDRLKELVGEDNVGEYFYFVDVDVVSRRQEEEDRILDIYRFFIPKVNITTVDQMLYSLLRAGKYHMRRFQFRNSVIVIDEYHLLPPEMIGTLSAVLSYYNRVYNFEVLLMTATPLGTYREVLKESLGSVKVVDLSDEYRRLRRHRIGFLEDLDHGVEKAKELLNKGRRVLVILNRVGRAIKFYKSLEEFRGSGVLLHSRFSVGDRYKKEGLIDKCNVLVATQVAEVSLDVSFDFLITDLAPIPSLTQRLGRVNRYGTSTEYVNAYIIEKTLRDSKPYLETELGCSLEILRNKASDLKANGEEVYLEMVQHYDDFLKEKFEMRIENSKRFVEKIFEKGIFSLKESIQSMAKKLRGEGSVLAVPHVYQERVRALFKKIREEPSFEKRRRLYAQVKEELVPVPICLLEACCSIRKDEILPFPIVGGEGTKYVYDPELGLHSKPA